MPVRGLIVDDERNIRTTLQVCLESFGCTATATSSADAALVALERETFDLAFVDLKLGGASGLDLLTRMQALRPELEVVIITAYATVDTAVEAIRRGGLGRPRYGHGARRPRLRARGWGESPGGRARPQCGLRPP